MYLVDAVRSNRSISAADLSVSYSKYCLLSSLKTWTKKTVEIKCTETVRAMIKEIQDDYLGCVGLGNTT